MKQLVETIEHCDWVIDTETGDLTVTGFCRVETDGVGQHHGDLTAQNKTSYKPDLDADKVNFCSIPICIAEHKLVPGVVIGCDVTIENLRNGRVFKGVVCGDLAPNDRTGEVSYKLAIALGVNPNPNTGGDDEHRAFRYTYHTNRPAPGFHLQPLGK